ncbi:MAG TPA: hypothetical protein VIM98_06135 [Dyella sp.]|uniref:hypothetical protein n=1 Tax=Dyella sp. TaxID=1869338 RepID=UPI002F947F29
MAVHKRYYAAAAMEVASGVMDQALWIKARVEAGNDEDAQRLYLQLRAEELSREGIKDQAKGLVKQGMSVWHGKPTSENPAPRHDGVLARLVGSAIILVVGGFVLTLFNQNKSTGTRNVGIPKSAGPTDTKYFYKQPLDFDGVVLGRPNVNVYQRWPDITCRTFEKPGYICEGGLNVMKVAGVEVTGPFKVLVDPTGIVKVGFVITQQESLASLKERYDFVLGPGTWQAHSPTDDQPGWVWQRDGEELLLQDLTSTDGGILVGVRDQ